jgi:zinc ribbon protein
MAAFGGHDACPNCGARMAADQRYCLNCGHRRGEPRLPFMDAVVFMESMSAPPGGGTPPPPPASSGGGSSPRMNANAALIAGVATLVLAIGVGFLIGRAGHDGSNSAAGAPIKVIEVGGGNGGGGGGEETAAATEESTESTTASNKGKGGNSSNKSAKKKKPSEVKEGSKEEEELAAEKTAETLHAEGPLAKPTAKVGEACEKGTPGCEGEEFTGNFFGE